MRRESYLMSVSLAEVLDLLATELDLESGDIHATSTMESVENWDSLGHLRVCMALEARFAIKIPMEQVSDLTSVHAILTLLGTD